MDFELILDLIKEELKRPVDEKEARYYGCQCAEDYARPLLARILRVLEGEDPRAYDN